MNVPEIFPGHAYRSLLQKELAARCRNNPRYSLRAFARFLGWEPSELSKILRGKRNLSARKIERIRERIPVKPKPAGEEASPDRACEIRPAPEVAKPPLVPVA